jgi:hypothetical protein
MEGIEQVATGGKILATIIRAAVSPPKTTFITADSDNFQLGFVVYPAGGVIARHLHRPLERRIVGTSEVLVVRRGRCEVDFYDDARAIVATRELRTGDVMLMLGGGHGFRMLEDTVFCEVKQGPYTGLEEKERF